MSSLSFHDIREGLRFTAHGAGAHKYVVHCIDGKRCVLRMVEGGKVNGLVECNRADVPGYVREVLR